MENKEQNWDNEWSGLEPSRNRSSSWGCWLGIILLSLVLLAACVSGVYLLWQRLDTQLQPGPVLLPPTAVSGNDIIPDLENGSSPEPPSLAPTVTLPAVIVSGNIEAAQLSFPPLPDGQLQDWDELPFYTSEYQVFNAPGWDGTDDVTAHWNLGWDSSNLYISVAVEDDKHVQTQTGNQIFKGDSVSLQLDTVLADFGSQLSGDDFQINLSPGDFAGIPPSAFRFRGTSSGSASDAPGHNIIVAARQVGEGYTMEAVIPWADLELSPAPGLVIGLALNVNDNDTPGTAVQEVMKSHIATRTFRDPTSWGTLTLR